MGSCSVDKYLQPGQKVLYRNEVNVVMADSSKVTPEVSEALSNVRQFYYQTPNKRFLFMPLRMRLYCSTNPDDSSVLQLHRHCRHREPRLQLGGGTV